MREANRIQLQRLAEEPNRTSGSHQITASLAANQAYLQGIEAEREVLEALWIVQTFHPPDHPAPSTLANRTSKPVPGVILLQAYDSESSHGGESVEMADGDDDWVPTTTKQFQRCRGRGRSQAPERRQQGDVSIPPDKRTATLCTELNNRLEDVSTIADVLREVEEVLGELSGSKIELEPALKEMVGKVARVLMGVEELPKEMSPFFLDPLFNAPEWGESCALMGYTCPAHEDNVSLGGETENRIITLGCGGGGARQVVGRERQLLLSEFVRALYFAALDANDVKVTRIVQSCGSEDLAKGPFHLAPWLERFPVAGHLLNLPTTPFFSSPHRTATKTSKSYHPGLAAKAAAQIFRARLGEAGPRLSDDGRAFFDSVNAGTAAAGFRDCPEYIAPPTRTSGSTASKQAVSNLRSSLQELFSGIECVSYIFPTGRGREQEICKRREGGQCR
ncbi:unnamed protein product [Ectocarpus sp. CCAP 1310/34]|nr:unnamed protein product [Ectocarpus sp. CCAP 1310/34]